MERELRELLEGKAAEVRPGFEIPPRVLRRARRRRMRTALVTAVVAGAVGVGGFLGTRAVLDGSVADGPPAQTAGEGEHPPATESDVRTFVGDFMRSRIRNSEAEAFLSEEARSQYDSHETGLYLYKPASSPYYGDFEILSLEALDANSFEAVVRIAEEVYPAPGVAVGSFTETLFVGPGTTHDGEQASLVIRGAMRDDTVAPPTPHEVRDFVSAFMDRRFTGRRAEPFLSPGAQAQYEAGTEQLSLYQARPEPEWRDYEVISVTRADGGQYEVTVVIRVEYPTTTEGDTITETLALGPGVNVQGFEARLVVLSARRVA